MQLVALVDGVFFRAISTSDETLYADKGSITSDVNGAGVIDFATVADSELDDYLASL